MKGSALYPLPGQISLFELARQKVTIKKKADASPASYLQKGENLIIQSLTREAEGKGLTFDQYEERLYQTEIGRRADCMDMAEAVAKTLRTMLRNEKEYDTEGEFMKFLHKVIDTPFELRPIHADSVFVDDEGIGEELYRMGPVRALMQKWHHSTDLLLLVVNEPGMPSMATVGYRAYSHPKASRDQLFRNHSCQVCHATDIAYVLAWLILITQFNRVMKDGAKQKAVAAAYEAEMERCHDFFNPQDFLDAVDKATFRSGRAKRELQPYGDTFFVRMATEAKAPLVMPDDATKMPSAAFRRYVEGACDLPEGSIKVMTELEKDYGNFNRMEDWQEGNRERLKQTKVPRPLAYVLDRRCEMALMACDPNVVAREGFEVRLSDFQSEKEGCGHYFGRNLYWMLPIYYPSVNISLLRTMAPPLRMLFAEKASEVATAKYNEGLKGESRAKAYQTKKNIPASTVEAMEKSEFNRYFGYVEYDELCDHDKVDVIANEFIAMKETYFQSLDLKTVSIRFRRLGNYKAAGIYFPFFRCLCVDIGNPSSLTHELGHCIDHTTDESGDLSAKGDFYRIWDRYTYLLDRYMVSGDDKKVERLSGNTKYGLKYFKVKTEVFARTFEMYCTRVLGINNSICKPDKDDDFAYPVDGKLDGMIKEYFDKLLAERLNKPVADETDEPAEELTTAA